MSDNPGKDQADHPIPTPDGRDLSDGAKANVSDAIADAKEFLKKAYDTLVNIEMKESGQHPSQDTPRHRPKL
jgi:hypothetical protein